MIPDQVRCPLGGSEAASERSPQMALLQASGFAGVVIGWRQSIPFRSSAGVEAGQPRRAAKARNHSRVAEALPQKPPCAGKSAVYGSGPREAIRQRHPLTQLGPKSASADDPNSAVQQGYLPSGRGVIL